MLTAAVPAGQTITASGTFLGQLTLDKSMSYVVSAGATATAAVSGALQCQLLRSGASGWDEMGEIDVSQRSTISLEHVYKGVPVIGTQYVTVYLACLTGGDDYVVDVAHLNAIAVQSVQGGAATAKSTSPGALSWAR